MTYRDIVQFMKNFGVDSFISSEELIIDENTNTYAYIGDCKDLVDIETITVMSLCRPIGKGLDNKTANKLLKRVNNYFEVDLTQEDMRKLYADLCYINKFDEFKDFIARRFPMKELKEV